MSTFNTNSDRLSIPKTTNGHHLCSILICECDFLNGDFWKLVHTKGIGYDAFGKKTNYLCTKTSFLMQSGKFSISITFVQCTMNL